MIRRTATLSIFAAFLALLVGLLAPAALAHHRTEHTQGNTTESTDSGDKDGDADSDSNTAYTEDNDTNDNNTADGMSDEGDNAHPSGNDKSVENGNSGTQGRSESNPDDSVGPMRYEGDLGDDKANGPGGTDLADQDGNNGCGNDDDFDDDNNGWCGKPTETDTDTEVEGSTENKPCDADATMPGTQPCGGDIVQGDTITDKPCPLTGFMGGVLGELCGPVDVGAEVIDNPAGPDVDADEDEVLGIRFNAAVQPAAVQPAAVQAAAVAAAPEAAGAVLPFTGISNLVPFLAVAMMLISAGALSFRGRRNEA